MAQYLRPNSDVTVNSWTGGYTTIDEVSFSDGDFITGEKYLNEIYECGLTDPGDPGVGTGHIVRFRAWQENNVFQRTLAAYLYQGTTLISSYTGNPITLSNAGAQAYSWTLSEAEANSITDYSDLRLRFTSGGNIGAPAKSRSFVYVSWAEMEIPDAAPITREGEASLSGTSFLTILGTVTEATWEGETSLIATSNLDAIGTITKTPLEGETSLQLTSSVDIIGTITHATWEGATSLSGESSIVIVGTILDATWEGQISLDATSLLNVVGTIETPTWEGETSLNATSSLTVVGTIVHATWDAFVSLQGTSNLNINGTLENAVWEGETSLSANSTLISVGTLVHAIHEGNVSLSEISSLTISGTIDNAVWEGAVSLSGTSLITSSVSVSGTAEGEAYFVATTSLTVECVIFVEASTSFISESYLNVEIPLEGVIEGETLLNISSFLGTIRYY